MNTATILPFQLPRLGRKGGTRAAVEFLARLIEADDRIVWIVRTLVNFEHVLHFTHVLS